MPGTLPPANTNRRLLLLVATAVLATCSALAGLFLLKDRLPADAQGTLCTHVVAARGGSLVHFFAAIVLVALAAIFCLPISGLETIIGFLLGYPAVVPCLTGKIVGGFGMFFLGKIFRTRILKHFFVKFPNLRHVDEMARNSPMRTGFFIRSVFIPMGIKNYSLAALDVGFFAYFVSLLFISAPYTILFVTIGRSGSHMSDLCGLAPYVDADHRPKHVEKIKILMESACVAVFLYGIVKLMKGHFQENGKALTSPVGETVNV